MDLSGLTIKQIHTGLINGHFSAVELTEAFLNEIKKRDKEIGSFLTISEKLALSQAKKTDRKIVNGEEVDILAGAPGAIKDIILVEGLKCTAGSKMLENYTAPYDATVVKRLKKAGSVILGKTNLDEFAMGSSNENSAFWPVKNPHDQTRVTGGSSGGSAAAVAANFCVYALGSDTGGSVRQPASFCGAVGLKPTYGRVSRYGLIAFASSLDQIGIFAKNTEDVAIVFNAIKGKDRMDSTSLDKIDLSEEKPELKNLKIGAPKEYFVKGIDSEVEKKVRQAIEKYEKAGAKIVEVSLPHSEYALPVYYIIQPAEASANLARYDGIKYGLSEPGKDLLEGYLKTRGIGFGDEVRRRIMIGAYTLSAGYYDAYYLKAQRVRTLIKQDFDKAFEKVDVLMGPTSPTTAFKLGERVDDPVRMYLADIYTVACNLAGIPAVSVPCGKVDGLPVGLQIIGRRFDDEKILKIAGSIDF